MALQNSAKANTLAVKRMQEVRPELIGISSAAEAMSLDRATILTSGPALPFNEYFGGQRSAIVGGALYEGLASDEASAIAALEKGEIRVRGCQEFQCVGSLAGVTTASMPVLVAADKKTGSQAYCTLYEGDSSHRLNYGSYTEQTRANLENLRLRVAPVLDQMIKQQNEAVDLRSIMARALTMGDELHSRNAAATLLLFRTLISGARSSVGNADAALDVLKDDYFFLRLSMAASKLMANAMRDIEHSTIVTGMAFSCKEFGVQVSGLGDTWFRGPVPTFEDYKTEPGFTIDDMEIMGGESIITEVVGLGGMAQAAAFALQRSSGDVNRMIARTEAMYDITFTESTDFLIPALNYRGAPLGIDLEKVVATKRTPYLNIGMAGRTKRQIGGGVAVAPLEPFIDAWKEFEAL